MRRFNQEEFNNFILDNGVIQFSRDPVGLSSGGKSHWYADFSKITGDTFLLEKLTDYIVAYTKSKGINPDFFYGVPDGMTQLGVLTQYKFAKKSRKYGPGTHPMVTGRVESKIYGTKEDRHFVGRPKGEVVVIEDVVTEGISLRLNLDKLRLTDSRILGVYVFLDRLMPNKLEEELDSLDIPLYKLGDTKRLIEEAYDRLKPGEDIGELVEKEFEEQGIFGIML